jgi:hypothetical protein
LGSSGGFAQVTKEADVNELLAAMLEEIKELQETPESVDLLGLEESVKVKVSRPQQSPNLSDL